MNKVENRKVLQSGFGMDESYLNKKIYIFWEEPGQGEFCSCKQQPETVY